MIGVRVQPGEQEAAREFFEFLKTSWEFARDQHRYPVLLCSVEPEPSPDARLVLIFSASAPGTNVAAHPTIKLRSTGAMLAHADRRFPIYGSLATFPGSQIGLLVEEISHEAAITTQRQNETTTVRVGYDLFSEVRHLLTTGQPVENAGIPTLELHLEVVRDLITRAGLPLVEIPPVPDGHDMVACLTHDIDHPILRNYRWDHTLLGFLGRATVGSLIAVCRGRMSFGHLCRNWAAVARLPFVHLGWAPDFWRNFDQIYLQLEDGRPSTFFVIPQPDDAGRRPGAASQPLRASRYDPAELVANFQRIHAAGSTVALHGLDAWIDAADGRREKTHLEKNAGPVENGVRMHWLYFGPQSPAALDEAGFTYDSTVGYNETVGYRAGTAQVYRPPGTRQLLELPLHVMDTALFYPSYLNLTGKQARAIVSRMMDDFAAMGGAFTVNWHDRSIAPERNWGEFYRFLLNELTARRAWFATAAQAVAWFQMRRSAVLQYEFVGSNCLRVRCSLATLDTSFPALRIRVHKPRVFLSTEHLATGPEAGFVDAKLSDTIDFSIEP